MRNPPQVLRGLPSQKAVRLFPLYVVSEKLASIQALAECLRIMLDAGIGETPVVAAVPFQVERVPEGDVVLPSVVKRQSSTSFT